jgi:prepilin-type N-terminal cleavage/methylation domain-containing protein
MTLSMFNLQKNATPRKRSAFTLIELLAVMGIIVILMSIVVGISRHVMKEQSRSKAREEIENFHNVLQTFRTETGAYPLSLEEIRLKLPAKLQTRLDRRSRSELLDPWERRYVYKAPTAQEPETYNVFSQGPKVEIVEDDIYSGK